MRMVLAFLYFATASTVASAQLAPPTLGVRTVGDHTNVFQQTRSQVEIFPTKRAASVTSVAGRGYANAVREYAAATPFSRALRGVVFNYDLQQYGFTTGEVAFMLKQDSLLPGLHLDASLSPKKIRVFRKSCG